MSEPPDTTQAPKASDAIPSAEVRVRALAFAGGAFDTIMQLGVAHALLVCRGRAPDYVVGVSAGAINAAALAEILQAGATLPPAEHLPAAIEKLRQFLNAYQEVPQSLLDAILPDALEVTDSEPLAPLELPIHFEQERIDRREANIARAGVARLLNHLWKIRLTAGTATRFIRHALGLADAEADPRWLSRNWRKIKAIAGIVGLGWRYPTQVGPLFWDLARAVVLPPPPPGRRSTGQRIFRWQTVRDLAAGVRFVIATLLFVVVWPIGLLVAKVLSAIMGRRLTDRALRHFSVADGLANTDVLKQQLVKCFDPHYYGITDLPKVLNTALGYGNETAAGKGVPRELSDYAARTPSITVAPIAANVRTGDLEVLPGSTPIVDGLLAATATIPIFPAVRIKELNELFIDGINVSNEALGPLIEYLRHNQPPLDTTIVDLYPISPLPVSEPTLPGRQRSYDGILDVAGRALQLRRFRDATLEQRLTKLYSKVLPPGQVSFAVGPTTYIRTALFPLEPDEPINVNQRVLERAPSEALVTLLYETVTDGCRAALEGMIPNAIRQAANGAPHVSCSVAMQVRLGSAVSTLPGSEKEPGPGLPEICKHCALTRPPKQSPRTDGDPPAKTGVSNPALPEAGAQQLRKRPRREAWPEWPQENEVRGPIAGLQTSDTRIEGTFDKRWPRGLNKDRPLVTLLFGGGVFRGVFHMGVANALNELGVQPDLVAGSSVGSIIAAMIAQMFAEPTSQNRSAQMVRLAATFLTMDRLIVTDRLADFVRRLTLRGAETAFAPRDLDLLLRRYDRDSEDQFGSRWRRVAAGLERLFYLTPFELQDLTKAIRDRGSGSASKLIEQDLQGFLDRSGVGREILGAEPLALLINNHVIERLGSQVPGLHDIFESFLETGIYFLATATNLHQGGLEILGAPYPNSKRGVSLLYGLLASSAFPAVFRPRESWEIFHLATEIEQYIDGGTIDNLPLDAVARFLDRASPQHVARRPRCEGKPVPHLLFTASLERDVNTLTATDDLQHSCLRLYARAATFTHNRKVEAYAKVQRDMRAIYTKRPHRSGQWEPVDLHVLAVKPQWLCGTFGFHPMLGFRRKKQAQSIAHGCASTLVAVARQNAEEPHWVGGWGLSAEVAKIHLEALPRRGRSAPQPQTKDKAAGECWFRKRVNCPFSSIELKKQPPGQQLPSLAMAEINKIYLACGKAHTHRAYEE